MSSKILVCVPIYFQNDKLKHSLNSILPWDTEGLEVTLALGVNGGDKETFHILEEFIEKANETGNFLAIHLHDFKENLGKGAAVNKLVELYGERTSFILSSDSDMVYLDPRTLKELIEAYNLFPDCSPINIEVPLGGMAANQAGMPCHVPKDPDFLRGSLYSYSVAKENNGVAGGVLLIPSIVWDQIGGYQAFNKYGSDDAHFMLDCYKADLIVPIVRNVSVYHPKEKDPEYAQWKLRSCQNTLSEEEKGGYVFKEKSDD